MDAPRWVVPALVVRVVDGDTVKLDLDLGWRVRLTANCRVSGINAAEVRTAPGERAKAYAETLLPTGATVTFESHSLDKYGRPLGAIRYGEQGRDFGLDMIDAGHAIRFFGE